jgi:hypothetical protein
MLVYPYTTPLVMTDAIFSRMGGKNYVTAFSQQQLQDAYLVAEIQTSQYIGTLLQPTIVTGTYNYQNQPRLVTDYGYVSNILSVNILTQNMYSASCDLQSSPGCAIISTDTYGYVDIQQLTPNTSLISYYGIPYPSFPPSLPFLSNYLTPYQFQIAYQCGLPTGVAYQPNVLRAMSIAAIIYLNDVEPGTVGQNEGVGDVGIDEFRIMDYQESRHKSSMYRNAFGSSAMANKAAQLIRSSVQLARRNLQL